MAACLKIYCTVSLANSKMELLFVRLAEVVSSNFSVCIISAYVGFLFIVMYVGAGLQVLPVEWG